MKINLNTEFVDEGMQNKAENMVTDALFSAMIKMESLAKQYAPSDTGELRRRINLKPTETGYKEYILSSGVDYGAPVEYGSRPHWPPLESLEGWSRRVLGNANLAYLVQRKIAMKGTSAQPYFRPALLEVKTIWLPRYKSQML